MSPLVPNRDEWFEDSHGFPRPNWTALEDFILTEVDAEKFDEAWDTATGHWLRRIQAAQPGRYSFAASKYLHLLSPHTERECARMLQQADRIYGHIANVLGTLSTLSFGKIVVLRFREAEEYYHYISHFHGEDRENPMSGGMFIAHGYPHIVCLADDFNLFCTTFAHELSHLLVAHLPLPAWVNEGVAMTFEADIGRSHLPQSEETDKHRRYWNEDTIQDFWSGESFVNAGEAFALGYGLAAVLFDIIRKELKPPPDAFRAFIQHADRADGGASAAQQYLRAELSEIVEEFLGPGDWNPRSGL